MKIWGLGSRRDASYKGVEEEEKREIPEVIICEPICSRRRLVSVGLEKRLGVWALPRDR